MPKNFHSNNAVMYILKIIAYISLITALFLNLTGTKYSLKITEIILYTAMILLFLIIIILISYKKNQATDCVLNLFNKNIIEFHIGTKCNGKKNKCLYYFGKTILKTLDQNKTIVFFTYHIKKENLIKMFGQAITTKKPEGIEKKANVKAAASAVKKHNKKYPNNKLNFNQNDYILCYLEPQKLTKKQLDKIKKIIKRCSK